MIGYGFLVSLVLSITTILTSVMSSTLADALPPADTPFILLLGGGSYSTLFAAGGAVAILGGLAILPVRRVR